MTTAFLLLLSIAIAGPPPPVVLTAAEMATLAKGRVVVRDSGASMAVAVLDIAAPPSAVWAESLNVEPRVEEVGSSTACEVYHRDATSLKVKWGIGLLGLSASFHLVYAIDNDAMLMSYTLDESKDNDIAYAVGSYQVLPHGSSSRLVYRSEADPDSKIPGFVRSILVGRSLRQQLGGIKTRAEAR